MIIQKKQWMANLSLKRILEFIPEGRGIPENEWRVRHHRILILVWLHALGLALFGIYKGFGPVQSLGEGLVIAAIACTAIWSKINRSLRSAIASIGLVTSSAVLVQFSGGYIEAHFHFFVMLAVIAVYQDWIPYLLAILFVAIEHGLSGQFIPTAVYNHQDAFAHPWKWAIIHAGFVLCESVALLAAWRINEGAMARADLVLNSAGEGIVGFDLKKEITIVNPVAANMTGSSVEALIGRSIDLMLKDSDGPTGNQTPLARIMHGEPVDAEEIFLRHEKAPQGIWLSITGGPLKDEFGRLYGGVIVLGNITKRKLTESDLGKARIAAMNMMEDAVEARTKTEQAYKDLLQEVNIRKQAEETIHHMAYYDPLTELPNRNMLYDRLLNTFRTEGDKGKPSALLLMDLNHFKEINDTLGHHCGDLLLKQVGQRLQDLIFDRDTIARLGGDEFAILLAKLEKEEDISLVIDKVMKAFEMPFVIEGVPVMVETSIGVAFCPHHGTEANVLMQRADMAMYKAKNDGVGHVIFKTEYDQYSPQRLALMAELRQAIEHDELCLYYQPKISFQTKQVTGVEALLRWSHPRRGMIPPVQFIEPAEQTGLIHPLTRWVLQTAVRQCRLWGEAGFKITISVNLSARNLLDPKLPAFVADLVKNSDIQSDCMIFEITESAIMVDPKRAHEILNEIHAMGFNLSIDDFGIGYSSLNYLKELPVNQIKVDRSFVMNMVKNENDAKIVRSTIELAHNLGLKVVAEGVETEEMWRMLAAMGCDEAQGYYMSKPLSRDQFESWLKESPWGLSKRDFEASRLLRR